MLKSDKPSIQLHCWVSVTRITSRQLHNTRGRYFCGDTLHVCETKAASSWTSCASAWAIAAWSSNCCCRASITSCNRRGWDDVMQHGCAVVWCGDLSRLVDLVKLSLARPCRSPPIPGTTVMCGSDTCKDAFTPFTLGQCGLVDVIVIVVIIVVCGCLSVAYNRRGKPRKHFGKNQTFLSRRPSCWQPGTRPLSPAHPWWHCWRAESPRGWRGPGGC